MNKERKILLKTPRGLEKIAASRVLELVPEARVEPAPHGYKGLVLVYVPEDSFREAYDVISREVLEAEKVFEVVSEAKADLEDIAAKAAEAARNRISPNETFAVRTTRRGSHNFTSIDVNVRAGAAIQSVTSSPVNLTYPDKIVWIEIIDDIAYITITEGREEKKKTYPGKPDIKPLLRKIAIAQVPYGGPLDAVRKVGVRIGRAAQTFELRELVIAPFKPVPAEELAVFISGVLEGIKSRLEIQRKTYSHKVHPVPVVVQDLYQFVRDRRDEPIIVTSTRGKAISEVSDNLRELFETSRRVNVLIGAREGLPTGIFRAASLIVDVAPGITLPTDHALTAIVVALIEAIISERKT